MFASLGQTIRDD